MRRPVVDETGGDVSDFDEADDANADSDDGASPMHDATDHDDDDDDNGDPAANTDADVFFDAEEVLGASDPRAPVRQPATGARLPRAGWAGRFRCRAVAPRRVLLDGMG